MLIELKNGRRTSVPEAAGRALVKLGRAVQVQDGEGSSEPAYRTRMMQAPAPRKTEATTNVAAPYGYKADGTPRKRPAPAPRKTEA